MPGKRLPPVETRFPPKTSGNPAGRPRGSKNKKPKKRTPVLDERVGYLVDGKRRRMSRREAIILFARGRLVRLASPKLRSLLLDFDRRLSAAEAAIDYRPLPVAIPPSGWTSRIQNIEAVVYRLKLGRMMYRNHPAQRIALEPEGVSLALMRLGDRRLTRDEQKLVVAFTVMPKKVVWPDWWDEDLRTRKVRLPKRLLKDDEADWKRMFTPPPPRPRPEREAQSDWAPLMDAEPEWICRGNGVRQISPCSECIRRKKQKRSECPNPAWL